MNKIPHSDDPNKQSAEHVTGQPGHRNVRLSRRILVPTLVIILFLIIGFFVYSFQQIRAENQARELEDSQHAETIFLSEINRLGDFALGLAIDSANNPEIQKAFAERDRARLTELTLDSYLALDQTFNIPQYQFHLPPATSFLRLHSPDKFGDDLSSFRYTVLQVNDSKQPVVGLEVGRGGLGLRGIEPVFYEGNHIGSVEFGLNVDQTLINNLKNEYGNDWRITLTRTALSLATLEDIAALQEGPSPDLLVLASTIEGVFPEPDTYNRVLKGEKEIVQVSGAQDRTYSVTVLPLLDYSGVTIGTVDVIFDRTEIVQAQSNRFAFIILVGLAAIFVSGFSLIYITNRSLHPLEELTKAAEAIQQGNLNLQVNVANRDEIGKLAKAFNAMTSQLRDLIGSLEQRLVDRTKALSSVAEVSTATSTILDTDKLLQQVVDLAKERFGFYHAHIYLLDATGTSLVLSSGAGTIGQQMVAQGHAIPLDREQSLVARAAREKVGVIVNDVTNEPGFLPNPMLPDTHSELAVPMVVGEQVVGVFDVQSETVGRFTDADIAVQTTLASQVASAVQNARSYAELQRNQSLLSDALKAARLGNWEYDFEHDLFYFTDEFYAIFRTTAEQVGGYKISSADYAKHFVHPEDAPLVGSEIQKVIESKERHLTVNLEHRIIFSDGEVGYIAVNINVERDENGKITRWYGANQDITERRRLEEMNRKRATQQEAINTITQKIQSTSTIEAALQVAVRELGHALGQRQTLVTLEPSTMGGHGELTRSELK